jgi:hypothetical protein
MTDYSVADELAAVIAEVRPEIAGVVHTDTYAILRTTTVADGRGGWTETTTTVETGRCRLIVAQRMGGEVVSGGRVTPLSIYTADLPIGSIVTENDTLGINGRTFLVTDTKAGGALALFVTVDLEERT